MINMIVLYKGLLLQEFYVNIYKMTWSDVAVFDKVKCTTSFPNASRLVTAEAMILNRHDHIIGTVIQTHGKFHRIFNEASLSNMDWPKSL